MRMIYIERDGIFSDFLGLLTLGASFSIAFETLVTGTYEAFVSASTGSVRITVSFDQF